MKVETTATLSEELLAALIDGAPDATLRSDLVESAVLTYLMRLRKRDSSNDLEIINAHATELNAEARDVLSYQVSSR